MSIRLMLDGHNFSQASHTLRSAGVKDAAEVVVSLDTAKTVLVPAYLCEGGTESAFLRFNGVGPADGERVVRSEKQGEIVALMSADAAVLDAVTEECGNKVRYTSPLLEITGGEKRNVNVFLTPRNAYIAVWEKALRYAEVLPDPSVDSVLYYLQVLGREFKLKRFDIDIGGERAGEVVASAADYFKHLRQVSFFR